jgi:aspartate racemase
MKIRKPIGAIGGMGPHASARMYELMIDIAKNKYNAKENHEYPEIVLLSIPVKDFFSNKVDAKNGLDDILVRVNKLDTYKPVCFGIACNTVHIFSSTFKEKMKIPFVSIIDETVDLISERGYKRVGVLGSPVTLSSGIYQNKLKSKKIETIIPNKSQIQKIDLIIRKLISFQYDVSDRHLLIKIADSLRKRGADCIVLGCTELPLIFPRRYTLPVMDTLRILSEALVDRYYSNENN